MIRDAARAIVVRDGHLLVMERNKYGKQYRTLVGGRLEHGEKPEQAVLREAMEETGLSLSNPRLVFIEEPFGTWGKQYIYLCDYESGEPELGNKSEEYEATQGGEDTYSPVWLSFTELENNTIPFRTEKLRQEIIGAYRAGFPDEPKQWTPGPA